MRAIGDCRLYGILDLGYVAESEAAVVVRQMLAGGVDILQIRAKTLPEDRILAVSRAVRPLTAAAGVPLILNDHPHLVAEAGADGVHVGQDDLPVAEARAAAGEGALVGKSTHSLSQAAAAAAEGPDYLGFGPLFATPTKPDYPAIGLDDIRRAHERVGLPLFCIGGIKLENLASVTAAGARRVVIVSGILQASDISSYTAAARALL